MSARKATPVETACPDRSFSLPPLILSARSGAVTIADLPTSEADFSALRAGPKTFNDVSKTVLLRLFEATKSVAVEFSRANEKLHGVSYTFPVTATLLRELRAFQSHLSYVEDIKPVYVGGVRRNRARAAYGSVLDVYDTVGLYVASVFSKGPNFQYRDTSYPRAVGAMFEAVVDCYMSMYELEEDFEKAVATNDQMTLRSFVSNIVEAVVGNAAVVRGLLDQVNDNQSVFHNAIQRNNAEFIADAERMAKLQKLRQRQEEELKERVLKDFIGNEAAQRKIVEWFDSFGGPESIVTIDDYNKILDGVKRAKEDAELERDDLKSKVSTLKNEKLAKSIFIEELLKEKEKTLKQLENLVKEKIKLEKELKASEEQRNEANKRVDVLQSKYIKTRKELEAKENELESITKQKDEQEELLKQLRADADAARADKQNADNMILKLQKDLKEFDEIVTMQDAEIKLKRGELEAETSAVKEADTRVKELEAKMAILQVTANGANEDFEALKAELAATKAIVRTQEEELEQTKLNAARNSKAVTDALKNIEAQKKAIEEEKNNLQGKNRALQTASEFQKKATLKDELLKFAMRINWLNLEATGEAERALKSAQGASLTGAIENGATTAAFVLLGDLVKNIANNDATLTDLVNVDTLTNQLKKFMETKSPTIQDVQNVTDMLQISDVRHAPQQQTPQQERINMFEDMISASDTGSGSESDTSQGPRSGPPTPVNPARSAKPPTPGGVVRGQKK